MARISFGGRKHIPEARWADGCRACAPTSRWSWFCASYHRDGRQRRRLPPRSVTWAADAVRRGACRAPAIRRLARFRGPGSYGTRNKRTAVVLALMRGLCASTGLTFSWVLFSFTLTSACSLELTSATSFDGAETRATCDSCGSGSASNTSVTVCAHTQHNTNITLIE